MQIFKTVMKKILPAIIVIIILCFIGCMPPAAEIETGNSVSVSAKATEGYFSDRVMLSWSETPETHKYILYRSEFKEGPYAKVTEVLPGEMKSRVENAEMLLEVPVVEEPPAETDPDYVDPVYLNVLYTSSVDLSGEKYILAGQTPELRMIIGSGLEDDAEFNFVASFPSGVVDFITAFTWGGYTIGQIASFINSAANRAICEVSEDGKYLKFSSSWGPIVFKNKTNSLSYSPIDYFIKDGVGKNDVLIANKDGIQVMSESAYNDAIAALDENDDPLGLAAFFGAEPEPEEEPADTGPEMIARIFNEGDAFYHDDINNETGKHYFYRVQALRENGTQVSLSNCTEGYKVSATASKAPQNLVVSAGEFSDKTVLSWEPVSGTGITYKVYRTLAYPGTFDSSSPLAENLTETTFEDNTVKGGKFLYRVVAFNDAGEEGRPSENAVGYRAVTNKEFLHIAYYETVEAEKRTAQALGKPRVADYASGANANLDIFGYQSGKVNYTLKVNVSSMSGTGTWTFSDYCNFSVVLNGNNSMDSDSSKDGDIRGRVEVSGIYTGYFDYFAHVDGGDVASGYFMVSQDGGAEERIDWTTDFNSSPN